MAIVKEFRVKAAIPHKDGIKFQTKDIKIQFTEEEWLHEELASQRIEEARIQVTAELYEKFVMIKSLR